LEFPVSQFQSCADGAKIFKVDELIIFPYMIRIACSSYVSTGFSSRSPVKPAFFRAPPAAPQTALPETGEIKFAKMVVNLFSTPA
jgi:hypothetical protein